MLERLHFLVAYIGSAALAAFLAVCLTSPRVDTFRCQGNSTNGAERCEFSTALATDTPELGLMNLDTLARGDTRREPMPIRPADIPLQPALNLTP